MASSPDGTSRSSLIPFVATHVVVGLIAAFFSADRPAFSSGVFIAIVFAQSTLIGMWWGLGETHWAKRLLIAGVLAIALTLELGAGIGELGTEIILLGLLPTLMVFGVAAVIRMYCRIAHGRTDDANPVKEGLQFSIFHMMAFTTAVAVLVQLARFLQPHFASASDTLEITAIAACYAATGVTNLWAALGKQITPMRVIAAITVAGGCAITGGMVLGDTDSSRIGFWAATVLGQAAIVGISLWIVRSHEYRLIAKAKAEA